MALFCLRQHSGPAQKAYMQLTGPDPFKATKDEAWDQILKKNPDEDESEVRASYLNEIKKIEKDARNSYAAPILDVLKPSDFHWMTIIDGCFFLQLALHILGGAQLLDYPEKHAYFGLNIEEKANARRIQAMFFVGNQIPCVVISALMKQPFFQDIIDRGIEEGIWKQPPSDLPRMVLYLLIVHPELEARGMISSPSFFSRFTGHKNEVPHCRENPLDLLHAWHCLVQGPRNDTLDSETDDALDIEAGVEDFDKNYKFPSATELKQKGIGLTKAKEGIREIHFGKNYLFFPSLYIPPFTFDKDTEPILQYLQSYEIQQKIGNQKHEVNAYILFMADLIQTHQDVNILESKGIIQVKKREQKERLPRMLSKLASSEGIVFTQNLRLTRAAIEDYSPLPRHLVSLALLFGLIQTVFTILQYFAPRGSN
ncbi:hypothetical protein CDL12_27300 [Handroanthus impetiginosus]|uniref:Uncharacterized protein n=1 Tax=Handroanthus impetiginosus TaxID=429701 RepID=A0A2G9G4E7_9LAMI|nr:hypothetical protein CDL12_27300 [Handroanthus impetiginosus]